MRLIIFLGSLSLALSACGPADDLESELGACAGKCDGELISEPATPSASLSEVMPLVECQAFQAEEQCTDPVFCHDQFLCTIKPAPAAMRWNSLDIRVRPFPLEENDASVSTLLDSSELLFEQGEDMVVDLGTLARQGNQGPRESYTLEIKAQLADLNDNSRVDFGGITARVEGTLKLGGEAVLLEAPCASWRVKLILPEEFNERTAGVRFNYLLTLPEWASETLNNEEGQVVEVSVSSRLRQNVKEATLLLPVNRGQEPIQGTLTYYPSQTTKKLTITPGDLGDLVLTL